jgi:uroporphyrinogen-III decarboxylase
MLSAVRTAVELAGDELLIIANFDQSPFSLAGQLRDVNQFMIDLVENRELAHRLLAFCAEAVSAYAVALAEAGAHVLNTGDSMAWEFSAADTTGIRVAYERGFRAHPRASDVR